MICQWQSLLSEKTIWQWRCTCDICLTLLSKKDICTNYKEVKDNIDLVSSCRQYNRSKPNNWLQLEIMCMLLPSLWHMRSQNKPMGWEIYSHLKHWVLPAHQPHSRLGQDWHGPSRSCQDLEKNRPSCEKEGRTEYRFTVSHRCVVTGIYLHDMRTDPKLQ